MTQEKHQSIEVKIETPGARLFLNDLPKDVKFSGSIAVDSEAMGLKIGRDRLCLVQIADENGDVYFVKPSINSPRAPNLEAVLADTNIQKIFHFARFDVALFYQTFGVMTQNIYCTKIASKLCRTYTDSHGLKELVREFLGINLSKNQQSSDWGGDNLSDEQLKYAASDVIYLHKLKKSLDSILNRESKMTIFKECISFLPSRAYLDAHGYEQVDIFAHS
jgi:ribonuclease D